MQMTCAIIILGSPNDQYGKLLPIAISRAEAALATYKRVGDCKLLCTGGYGDHFNTTKRAHGYYMQEYLTAKGVPSSSFLDIALSSYTLEDAKLAKPIIESNAMRRVILVTSDYHMERARYVFSRVLPDIQFHYVEAKTAVSDVEYLKLLEHEKNAIQREMHNLKA